MTPFRDAAYALGCVHALVKLGMGTAEDFAGLAKSDETREVTTRAPEEVSDEDKPVHWGGGASLEGGDSGTRQDQMGLPASAAV